MIPGNPMKPELGRVGALRRIPRGVRGIGLIEVMVSVLVLAVGLLGIAAMQSLALRGGQGSLESSQAVMQTGSILEAMRANPGVDYTMAKQCSVPTGTASLVAYDRREWIRALKNTIGSGELTDTTTCGQIACNAGVCTVTVFWNDVRAGSDQGGTARNLETSARI